MHIHRRKKYRTKKTRHERQRRDAKRYPIVTIDKQTDRELLQQCADALRSTNPSFERKFSPEILAKICKYIRLGASLETASVAAGITISRVRAYLAKYPGSQDLINEARRAREILWLTKLQDGRTKTDQISVVKWLLERICYRRYSDRWLRKKSEDRGEERLIARLRDVLPADTFVAVHAALHGGGSGSAETDVARAVQAYQRSAGLLDHAQEHADTDTTDAGAGVDSSRE